MEYQLKNTIENPLGGYLRCGNYCASVFKCLKLDIEDMERRGLIEKINTFFPWEKELYLSDFTEINGERYYSAKLVNKLFEKTKVEYSAKKELHVATDKTLF